MNKTKGQSRTCRLTLSLIDYSMSGFPRGNLSPSERQIRVLICARDWFGKFYDFSFPPFFPPRSLPLGRFHMLMARAIVWANSLEFLPTKEKWRWKERGEKGTDRQRERNQTKVGRCTSEAQSTIQEALATKVQRAPGRLSCSSVFFSLSLILYASLRLLTGRDEQLVRVL